MSEFERCLEERRLVRIEGSYKMIEKEQEGAKYDLGRAEESLHNEDYKWASVQAYYSMFHMQQKPSCSKKDIEKRAIIAYWSPSGSCMLKQRN